MTILSEFTTPTVGIEIVESPDEGGWYATEFNRKTGAERASIIYTDRAAVLDALRRNAVEWDTK